MNPDTTPNADLIPNEFQIGKWKCHPFSLKTAILLERIGSPFMKNKIDPETGRPVPTIPTITELAEALYVMLNWHNPAINQVVADEVKFNNEVSNLAGQINMKEFAQITVQLNDMMTKMNEAVAESGLPESNEKKEGTGSLA